ncbi:MAG: SLC13 family permease [Pirellulales bacterium]|nr:SLC13 family permease [Pirellulales bacterium]
MVLTFAVLILVFGLLAFSRLSADVILIAGVLVFLVAGTISTKDALAGLANEGLVSVALLYVVGAGMQDTGGMTLIAEKLLGRPKSSEAAVVRLMTPVAFLSAFMNNTPLVAMMIPVTADWAKQNRIPVSKLMMPLSFAAILGGVCTLVGTSTNLVVSGLVTEAHKVQSEAFAQGKLSAITLPAGLGFLDITWVGVPVCAAGILFLALTSRWLLPNRVPPIDTTADAREYTVDMLVPPESALVGKSIEEAGLRHLPGVFLAEIQRNEFVIPAVAPQERLQAGDRLVFVGIVDSVIDLRKIRGLVPATNQVKKISTPSLDRCLIEAVVSNSSPLLGQTIRDAKFRTRYNAVVLAVARNGERIKKKIGDIVLEPGDTLLIEAHPSFADAQRRSRDFFLVSRVEDSTPVQHERAGVAILILFLLVVGLILESSWDTLQPWLGLPPQWQFPSLITLILVAGTAMLLTGCTTIAQARRSMDWEVILSIAASFALAKALEKSGAAQFLGESINQMGGGSDWVTLAIVYFVTLFVTELVTNNAAAALMFPLALQTADAAGMQTMPFIIAIMIAASCGFATPIGYQTNLMVYGPGGYKFSDYLKIGIPLDILVGIVTILVIPWVYPLR